MTYSQFGIVSALYSSSWPLRTRRGWRVKSGLFTHARLFAILYGIQKAVGPHEDLLTIVKRRKLQWYGHVSHLSGLAKKHFARHSERGKKTRHAEEEVGRQHQGMDRPGVRQVPEGNRKQGNMETTGCKIICGAPTTLAIM